MKEQIQSYVAPDLSGIEEQIAVQAETIESQNTSMEAMRTLIVSQETVIGALKETINRVDGDQQTLFTDFRSVDKRLYELERDTGQELIKVRKSIREQIEGYLAHKWSLTGGLPSTHPYQSSSADPRGTNYNSVVVTGGVDVTDTSNGYQKFDTSSPPSFPLCVFI